MARQVVVGVRWALRHPRPALLVGVTLGALWGLWGYAQRAEAFRITQVSLPANSSLKVKDSLIGTNLWELDIHALANELSAQQPWLRRVRVVRQLPNAIQIQAIPRVPIAQVRVGQWYLVDQEGFILPGGQLEASDELIRLVGCEGAAPALRPGKLNPQPRLELALRVLKTLRRSPALVSRRVTEINVTDPEQIRFTMGEGTEVRCGSEEELGLHLERLHAALKVIASHQMALRSIDVRFKEPVVTPQT